METEGGGVGGKMKNEEWEKETRRRLDEEQEYFNAEEILTILSFINTSIGH